MWKIYGMQCNVKCVENISRRSKNHGTLAKKALNFCWFLFDMTCDMWRMKHDFIVLYCIVMYWCYYPHQSRDSLSPVIFLQGRVILGVYYPVVPAIVVFLSAKVCMNGRVYSQYSSLWEGNISLDTYSRLYFTVYHYKRWNTEI